MVDEQINQRIKEIRKSEKLSQAAFGAKLGVSKDVIGNIEYNRVEPKTLFINYLCEVFNVNKNWILTGKGEKYIFPETDDKLSEALAKISYSDNEQLKLIVQKLLKLDTKYIDLINNLIDGLIEKK